MFVWKILIRIKMHLILGRMFACTRSKLVCQQGYMYSKDIRCLEALPSNSDTLNSLTYKLGQ
jgi:hypothetical protein